VQDPAQQVGVGAAGHRREEVARDDLHPVGDARQHRPRPRDDVRLVHQHAAHRGMGGEHGGEQRARPATDVGDDPVGGEVVRGQHGVDRAAGERPHRGVEQLAVLRVAAAVLPDVDAELVPGRVLPGPDAVAQRAPGPPLVPGAEHADGGIGRQRVVAAQVLAHPGQREAAGVVLVQDADRGDGAQQPVERVGVGVRRGGQVVDGERAVAEEVRDAQLGGHRDRLRPLVAAHDLEEGGELGGRHTGYSPIGVRT
jgi:hypothetical protein